MATLTWESWPRITFKESRRLLEFFESKGKVIRYQSHQKYIYGAKGRGIVVFKDPWTAQKLLDSQEEIKLDMTDIFDPFNRSSVKGASQSPEVRGKREPTESFWNLILRNLEKSPQEMNLSATVSRGIIDDIDRYEAALRRYQRNVVWQMPSCNADVKNLLQQRFEKSVREFRHFMEDQRRTKGTSGTEEQEHISANAESVENESQSRSKSPVMDSASVSPPEVRSESALSERSA